MKKQYVRDLRVGERVRAVFLVDEVRCRVSRDGNPSMDLRLKDKTGVIGAKFWQAPPDIQRGVGPDDFVQIEGAVQDFQNNLQIVVKEIRKVESGFDPSDFLPRAAADLDALLAELDGLVALVADEKIRALLASLTGDPEVRHALKLAPAGVRYHHAYVGGLLVHVVNLCRLARRVAGREGLYPFLDPDLLLAGCVLHDIGKTRELTFTRSLRYTDTGELLGHIALGLLLLQEHARRIEGFPPALLDRLGHMILSHHGELENGSPRLPATAEALALHALDTLDARLESFRAAVEEEPGGAGRWTWNEMLKRRLFRGDPRNEGTNR